MDSPGVRPRSNAARPPRVLVHVRVRSSWTHWGSPTIQPCTASPCARAHTSPGPHGLTGGLSTLQSCPLPPGPRAAAMCCPGPLPGLQLVSHQPTSVLHPAPKLCSQASHEKPNPPSRHPRMRLSSPLLPELAPSPLHWGQMPPPVPTLTLHISQVASVFPTSWDSSRGSFRLCPQTDLVRGPLPCMISSQGPQPAPQPRRAAAQADPHWLLLPPARGHPTQGSPAPRSTFHPQHPGLPAQAARADPRGERHTRPGAASLAHSLLCDSAVRSVLARWRDPGESDERTRNRVHALLAPRPGVRGCRGQRAGQVGPDAPGRRQSQFSQVRVVIIDVHFVWGGLPEL